MSRAGCSDLVRGLRVEDGRGGWADSVESPGVATPPRDGCALARSSGSLTLVLSAAVPQGLSARCRAVGRAPWAAGRAASGNQRPEGRATPRSWSEWDAVEAPDAPRCRCGPLAKTQPGPLRSSEASTRRPTYMRCRHDPSVQPLARRPVLCRRREPDVRPGRLSRGSGARRPATT